MVHFSLSPIAHAFRMAVYPHASACPPSAVQSDLFGALDQLLGLLSKSQEFHILKLYVGHLEMAVEKNNL